MLDLYTRAMKASAHQGKLRNQEDKLDWFYVIQKECTPEKPRGQVGFSRSVMTTLRKVSDFVYFLPFLFALYHHLEPSGTFYPDPHAAAMTHTLDHFSMT